MSICSCLHTFFSFINKYHKTKKNCYRFLFICCIFFLSLGLCSCSFFNQDSPQETNQSNKNQKNHGSDIADTDFGNAILSLLTPKQGSEGLTDKDIQEAFSYFCQQSFLQEISSDSISLHYTIAYPENFGLKNISPSFGETNMNSTEAVSAENYLYLLSQFPYDSLTESQQLTYQVFEESLKDSIALAEYQIYAEPLSKTIGIQAQLPVLLSQYTFYQKQDVNDYLELLSHLPAYFEQLAAFEYEKANQGLFMHEENAAAILSQCEEMVLLGNKKEKDNFLIMSFKERIEQLSKKCRISDNEKSSWIKKNKRVLQNSFYPAYEYLGSVFTDLLTSSQNNSGLSYFPKGKQYYKQLVCHNTGSDRSIAELKTLINNYILSCASKLSLLMKQENSLDIALSEAENYTLALPNAETTLSYLKTQLSQAFPMASEISCSVFSVPESLSEYLSPAFYLVPPIDYSTENCIYINTPQIKDDLSFFTTLAHEGYPGHLYQNAMFQSSHPEPLRTLLSYPGYSEGWATYAELYSYELSGLSDTAALLQQNNALLTLCMYAMADIHIHYDGYTEGGLKDYLHGFGITNENSIHAIYLQILAEPANYLKYTIGCLEFLSLKEDLQEIAGEKFDLRAFHESVLSTGPCSFRLLRKNCI